MPAWKIERITEGRVFDASTGRILGTKVVTYTVGKHGPFQLEVPAAEFTSARVAALLDEQAGHIQQLTPQG